MNFNRTSSFVRSALQKSDNARRIAGLITSALLMAALVGGLLPANTFAAPLDQPGLAPKDLDDPGVTPQGLATSLAGPGVAVSSGATFTGAANAGAMFNGANPDIVGFSDGVILGTGFVKSTAPGTRDQDFCITKGVEGPNECTAASADNGKGGDADIATLSGGATKDAAVLQFDFVPASSAITMQYVFSSEDYLEYIGRGADVVGIFVNGTNCATVGSPAEKVSADTVNNNKNSSLYRNNPSLDGGTPAINAEPDGLTTVLTCAATVTAGQTNKMKLAIADVGGNSASDSNTFVKAASLVSAAPVGPPGAPTGLTAAPGDSKVNLSWTAPAGNGGSALTGYKLYRGTASGQQGATPLATLPASATTYTDSTATNGTKYYYKVSATNSAGEGPSSNEASATPAGPGPNPDPDPGPDPDPAPGDEATFEISDVTQEEGDRGATKFVFSVELSKPLDAKAEVRYRTVTDTAGRKDFGRKSGKLRFRPGQTTKTVTVNVRGDRLNEGDEQFFVELFAPRGAGISDEKATGEIVNDDPLPTLRISDVAKREGNRTLSFRVLLSEKSGRPVTFNYTTVDGTAVSGEDFIAAEGTVTIPAGKSKATIKVRVKEDKAAEGDETFVVQLADATHATIVKEEGIGTIKNDD